MQLLFALLVLVMNFPADTVARIHQVEIVQAMPHGRCGEADLGTGRLTVSAACPSISPSVDDISWEVIHEGCHFYLNSGSHGDDHIACMIERLTAHTAAMHPTRSD